MRILPLPSIALQHPIQTKKIEELSNDQSRSRAGPSGAEPGGRVAGPSRAEIMCSNRYFKVRSTAGATRKRREAREGGNHRITGRAARPPPVKYPSPCVVRWSSKTAKKSCFVSALALADLVDYVFIVESKI